MQGVDSRRSASADENWDPARAESPADSSGAPESSHLQHHRHNEAVKAVLDRRVNGLGVAESTLQTVGDNQLVLQLPGVTDPSRAARVLGSTALLEFRSQKPGSEDELRSLIQLRAQLKSVLALNESKDPSEAADQDDGPTREQLAKAQKELGLEGTADSEQEQLEQLPRVVQSCIGHSEATL